MAYLKTDQDEITDNQEEMCKMTIKYFIGVFAKAEGDNPEQGNPINRVIVDEQNAMLIKELEFEEFKRKLRKCNQTNHMGLMVTQHFWGFLRKEIFDNCKSWLRDCSFPPELKNTTLVLTPKKDNVERMKDVRPIALCNVLYKILERSLRID